MKRTGADEVSRILDEGRGAAMLLKFADSALFISGEVMVVSVVYSSTRIKNCPIKYPCTVYLYTYINLHNIPFF